MRRDGVLISKSFFVFLNANLLFRSKMYVIRSFGVDHTDSSLARQNPNHFMLLLLLPMMMMMTEPCQIIGRRVSLVCFLANIIILPARSLNPLCHFTAQNKRRRAKNKLIEPARSSPAGLVCNYICIKLLCTCEFNAPGRKHERFTFCMPARRQQMQRAIE